MKLKIVSFDNVFKGFDFEKGSHADYDEICKITKGYDKVIALGQIVHYTLKNLGINHFTLPHPSGRNIKLNDQKYVESVLKECKNYLWT